MTEHWNTMDESTISAVIDAASVGSELAYLLEVVDPQAVSADVRLSLLAGAERLQSWAVAVQDRVMVAHAGLEPRIEEHVIEGRRVTFEDGARSDIAQALLWSEAAAHRRLTNARTTVRDLPRLQESFFAGALSSGRAAVIAEGARLLTSRIDEVLVGLATLHERSSLLDLRQELLEIYEERTVSYARTHSISRTRAYVRRVLAGLDPEGAAHRRERAMCATTDVTVQHLDDGMSVLTATLPSEQAVACLQHIDFVANDPANFDQSQRVGMRRALALQDLLTAPRPSVGDQDASAGLKVRLNVTIDSASLLGLRGGSAELEGVGPIPAEVVRTMLATEEASIRWLVTDAVSGIVTDASADTYRLGAGLRALVRARDRVCAQPNCGRAAAECQIDHIKPFDSGGRSSPENLQPLCNRHHQRKTLGAGVSTARSNTESLDPLHRLANEVERLQSKMRAVDALERRRAEYCLTLTELEQEQRQSIELELDRRRDLEFAARVARARDQGLQVEVLERVLDRHHAVVCRSNDEAVPHHVWQCRHLDPMRATHHVLDPWRPLPHRRGGRSPVSDDPGF